MKEKTLIAYRNVDICHQELSILKDVNINVNSGDFIYLLGDVGSGKSSLLKSFYSEIPISSGEARLLEFDLKLIKEKEIPLLRRQLGIVFQDFQLLIDRTVKQNLEFVLKATRWKDKQAIDSQIESVLQRVGMETKAYKMPHQLSGGEQQRIVIARALLNSPQIILADEPTGNLDQRTGSDLLKLLHDISRKGTTVIMATHNWGWVSQFPGRIFRCREACVEELSIEDFNKTVKDL